MNERRERLREIHAQYQKDLDIVTPQLERYVKTGKILVDVTYLDGSEEQISLSDSGNIPFRHNSDVYVALVDMEREKGQKHMLRKDVIDLLQMKRDLGIR